MKKLCTILCLLCLLLTASCGSKPAAVSESADAALPADYEQLLIRCREMLDRGDPLQEGFPDVLKYEDGSEGIGYAVKDLNGDDVPELLIGFAKPQEDGYFLGLYTYSDGAVRPVALSGERSPYYLCEGGVIKSAGGSTAWESELSFWRLTPSGTLQFAAGYFTEEAPAGYPGSIVYYQGLTGAKQDAHEISEAEAMKIEDQFAPEPIAFTPLSTLNGNAAAN